MAHPARGVTRETVLAACGRRILSDGDVQRIKLGQEPLVKMEPRCGTAQSSMKSVTSRSALIATRNRPHDDIKDGDDDDNAEGSLHGDSDGDYAPRETPGVHAQKKPQPNPAAVSEKPLVRTAGKDESVRHEAFMHDLDIIRSWPIVGRHPTNSGLAAKKYSDRTPPAMSGIYDTFAADIARLQTKREDLNAQRTTIHVAVRQLEQQRDHIDAQLVAIDEETVLLSRKFSENAIPPPPLATAQEGVNRASIIARDSDASADNITLARTHANTHTVTLPDASSAVSQRRKTSHGVPRGTADVAKPRLSSVLKPGAAGMNPALQHSPRLSGATKMVMLPLPHVADVDMSSSNISQENRPKQEEVLSSQYPSVIFLDDHWTEITCGDCGANTNPHTGAFFLGVRGLHTHAVATHKDKRSTITRTVAATLGHCGRRILSQNDVERLRAGKNPKVAIVRKYSTMLAASVRASGEGGQAETRAEHRKSSTASTASPRARPSSVLVDALESEARTPPVYDIFKKIAEDPWGMSLPPRKKRCGGGCLEMSPRCTAD